MTAPEQNPLSVLFLCTGNSARSIMAEAITNRMGDGKLRAYSAGSFPRGQVNPHAVKLLNGLGYDTSGFRSKSWDEFAAPGAPTIDFIITVCDNAAGEVCPIWPGKPISAHWGIPDPIDSGSEVEIALSFADAYRLLARRIELFTSLPLDKLTQQSLKAKMDEIGRGQEADTRA